MRNHMNVFSEPSIMPVKTLISVVKGNALSEWAFSFGT